MSGVACIRNVVKCLVLLELIPYTLSDVDALSDVFVLVHDDSVKNVTGACTYISHYLLGSTTFYHERYDHLKK